MLPSMAKIGKYLSTNPGDTKPDAGRSASVAAAVATNTVTTNSVAANIIAAYMPGTLLLIHDKRYLSSVVANP